MSKRTMEYEHEGEANGWQASISQCNMCSHTGGTLERVDWGACRTFTLRQVLRITAWPTFVSLEDSLVSFNVH
jgi:hypothetical protein